MPEQRSTGDRIVDLHVHSSASDGTLSPSDLVDRAASLGLAAIALTDHDTMSGLEEAADRGRVVGMEVVPGIELSSYAGGTEVHIIGLFVDPGNREASSRVDSLRRARRDRMLEMVHKLALTGISVDPEEVLAEAADGSVGRPHLAHVLVRRGYAPDEQEAFIHFLRPGCPAYVRKKKLLPEEAIALIIELRGLPVFAHPAVSDLDGRLADFRDAGLAAIEVWHPKHSDDNVVNYKRLAEIHGLLPCGGSDYHGHGRSVGELGSQPVEYSVLEALREHHAAVARD